MEKITKWMTEVFAPKANKLARNPWVQAIQESMTGIMPFILLGSIITIFSIFQENLPFLPDLSQISNFSFGLASVFVAYLIPYLVLEKKKKNKFKKQAGLTGIAFFLMLVYPTFSDSGEIVIEFAKLGSGGMFAGIIGGLFVAFVMLKMSDFSMFKKDTTLPSFLVEGFDSILPIGVILLIGWVCIFHFGLNLYGMIYLILSPLVNVSQSLWGFVLIIFLQAFLYSFGISSWVLEPLYVPIGLQAIGQNAANLAHGIAPSLILTNETFQGWIWIGGSGSTLMLSIFLLFAKSARLKTIGRSSIVPSLCNINEPLVYGTPVVFNPILMIPMWISGIAVPAITYMAFQLGFVSIPTKPFALWYLPVGIQTWLINGDFRGLILLAVLLAITGLIYYPFFKVFDLQTFKEEKNKEEQK
jgi:Phosphotransferase system cellobiose-specific component IIC